MPNWAEGNIRFRGKRENLLRFFVNELEMVKATSDGKYQEIPVKMKVDEDGWRVHLIREAGTQSSLYFRGSNRQFVDMEEFECDFEFSEGPNQNADQIVILTGYKGAWNIDVSFFKEKAVQYKIDIRIFVWEQGLEWSSVNTWYRNGKMEEESRTYADWLWDASMPYYGG